MDTIVITSETTLDCGHKPTPRTGIGTGYATTDDNRLVCYDCANSHELYRMNAADNFMGYLSSDGKNITTWTGFKLATVTHSRVRSNGGFAASSTRVYFNAVDAMGNRWYGSGPGGGMYCRIHRRKNDNLR
jgi:hypothetical protein